MERSEYQKHIGVGERTSIVLRRAGQTRRTDVLVEDGPRRGRVGGFHTEHWDGRVDATVLAPAVNIKTRAQEID